MSLAKRSTDEMRVLSRMKWIREMEFLERNEESKLRFIKEHEKNRTLKMAQQSKKDKDMHKIKLTVMNKGLSDNKSKDNLILFQVEKVNYYKIY